MSHTHDFQLTADEAPDGWSDLQDGPLADAERHAVHNAMAAAGPARPRTVVPLGRVLAVACFVPILAMIVLGASRFDDVPAFGVKSAGDPLEVSTGVDSGEPEDGDQVLADAATSSQYELIQGDAETPLLRVKTTEMMEVTAYCPCVKCCGKQARGLTASGNPVSYNGGRFVAADTRLLPFGTKLRIDGYHDGAVVEVIDRGGAIKGNKIDVYFSSHEKARKWGRQRLPV